MKIEAVTLSTMYRSRFEDAKKRKDREALLDLRKDIREDLEGNLDQETRDTLEEISEATEYVL